MNRKKVTIKAKPTAKTPARSADDWVSEGAGAPAPRAPESAPAKAEKEPTTRYTIDIPTPLHKKMKARCAVEGWKMNEEVIKLLRAKFDAED